MRLDKVRLTNYRCHRDLEVRFTPNFNVLVGVNGSGKTSVLRAIAESFTGLARFIASIGLPVQPLPPDTSRLERVEFQSRLRFEPQYPVTVEATGNLNNVTTTWSFTIASAAKSIQWTGSSHTTVQQIAQNQPQASQPAQTLPVLAFYRATRQWDNRKNSELSAATQKYSRADGYRSYWDASADSGVLNTWVISKCLERFQISSETGIAFDDIQDDELALVNGAISNAIEEAKGIKYDMREKSLLVEWNEPALQDRRPTIFDNLSDGQKAIIGLIADIARRICLLNPHLGQEAMKQTPGIVLIDELDMHLHPKWQRALTRGLQAAFPSVQFIVASHSPQVLSEMRPEQIIVLTAGSTAHPQVSYGLDSSAVLEEIMGATARPTEVEDDLSKLFVALEKNELDTARQLLTDLRNSAPGIAELNRAEALLTRKEVLGR
jgi:predicted ATP-binding protein involved in virulence